MDTTRACVRVCQSARSTVWHETVLPALQSCEQARGSVFMQGQPSHVIGIAPGRGLQYQKPSVGRRLSVTADCSRVPLPPPKAFRHSYGLTLEWRFWEPLVLMIDEVYRSRADGTLAAMRSAQQEKLKVGGRVLRSVAGDPPKGRGRRCNTSHANANARGITCADRRFDAP
jgi:hypothetical protein